MAQARPLTPEEWDKFVQELANFMKNRYELALEGFDEWAKYTASEARRRAPVDTGNLRRSITSKILRLYDGAKVMVGTNVKYAPFVEFGTGIYAEGGRGRQTPWIFVVKSPSVGMKKKFGDRMRYSAKHGGYVVWTRGSRPQPYLRPAWQESMWKIPYFLKKVAGPMWK